MGRGLGLLLGALGRFLAVLGTFKIELLENIGPRWAPRGLLDRFWVGLKRIWKDSGRIWEAFGISKLKHLGQSCTFLAVNRLLSRDFASYGTDC